MSVLTINPFHAHYLGNNKVEISPRDRCEAEMCFVRPILRPRKRVTL